MHFLGKRPAPLDAELHLALQGQHMKRLLELSEKLVQHDRARLDAAAASLEATDVEQLLHETEQSVRLQSDRSENVLLLLRQRAVNPLLEQLQIDRKSVV